jgi:hypothetical protein
MSKQKKDKQVLKNLERIVSGEKLPDDSELDEETRKALELTREMTSWSKSPPKEFKSDLKARLTHQLAEQDKQELHDSKNPEDWHIFHRSKWQLTVAAIILVIIIAIITVIILLSTRVLSP